MKNFFLYFLLSFIFISQPLQAILTPADKAELGLQKNFWPNGGFERGIAQTKTYFDAPGSVPVDATGGSPTHLTRTASGTSPLEDSLSLIISNSGGTSAQGEGVSVPFSVPAGQQGSNLRISFDYILSSGTFVPGTGLPSQISDLMIYVYDVTNGALIAPDTSQLTCQSVSLRCTYIGNFQASSGSSFRLAFHVASTNTSAWAMKIDSGVISRPLSSRGFAGTEFQSYTPTFSASFGTTSNVNVYWKQVGSDVLVFGTFQAGTVTAALATVSLPSGLNISATLPVNALNYAPVGTLTRSTATAGLAGPYTALAPNSGNLIYFGGGGTTQATAVAQNASSLSGNNEVYTFRFQVPVAGWSANALMSAYGGDTRPIAAKYYLTANQAVGTGDQKVTGFTQVFDSVGSTMNGSSQWVAPGAGYYGFNFTVNLLANVTIAIAYKINGGATNYIGGIPTFSRGSGGELLYLKAGDYLEYYVNLSAGTTLVGGLGNTYMSVFRVSGFSPVLTSDPVTAGFTTLTSASVTALTPLKFTTTRFDSHAGGSAITSAGTYATPSSGKYRVTLSGFYHATGTSEFSIYVNGVTQGFIGATQGARSSASGVIAASQAGALISVVPSGTCTLGTTDVNLYIERIGN